MDHVIGAKEAAELWNVTEGHIKNLCSDGEIIAKKVGNAWVIEKNQPHIAIKQHLKIITGAPFIQFASIFSTYDEYKKVTIKYISSFDEYVKENKEGKITNDDYQEYFWTGDKINKILAIEPARILNKFPETDEVEIVLPFNDKINKVSVKRKHLNQYLGYKIEHLSFKKQTWHEKFLKDVSSKAQRAKLIKQFS